MFEYRSLITRDIEKLDEEISDIENNKKKSISTWFIVLVLFSVIVIVLRFAHVIGIEAILAMGISIYGVFTWSILELHIQKNKEIKRLNEIKTKNKVLAMRVKPSHFIQISELADEGDQYLFQLPNHKILCVRGYEFEGNENFPNDDFEIVIAKDEKNRIIFLEINTDGKKIEPYLKLPANENAIFTEAQIAELMTIESYLRGRIELITGDLNDFKVTKR